jgi:AcrR family transcriptional regulator
MSPEPTQARKRRYRKRRRAESEQQTRERITEAAVRLHGTVGPARTTISGVAAEAEVQRATVYRHFPTEESLFAACSAHYWARHPRPDPGEWIGSDPDERLRVGLAEIYAFFAENEAMLARTSRDAALVPALSAPRQMFADYLASVAEALLRGRRDRGGARRRTAAAIGHAVSFSTWHSLCRQQDLSEAEAVAVMAAAVESASSARP